MAETNWGLIRSGATFEEMVTTLVGFDDPRFVPLSRPGKDDGQDIRSSDGTTVYQAKFHKDESAATAIRDAKKEAKKHKKRMADGGKSKEVWKGVKHWILVTNAAFNAQNVKTWEAEVQPLFHEIGLTAQCWPKGELKKRLVKHPEVHQAYFEASNRVFLNLKEALQLPSLDLGSRASHANFQGRIEELETFKNFLADDSRRILVVHGPGGVGKTRFLWEAACSVIENWSPLWALVASMAQSDAWFATLIPERPTLVLIDGPEDDVPIKVFIEQLAGRAKQWKTVIALRSTSSVLSLLRSPQQRGVQELELPPLAHNEALALGTELITCEEFAERDDQWRATTAAWVAERFDGFPVWIAMAIDLIIRRGNLTELPETSAGVAQEYVNEVCDQKGFPSKNVLAVLRWVSLLAPFNTALDDEMKYITEKVGLETSLARYLDQLVTRKVLFRRGAYDRLIEIKPDVLAEHIQRNWLVEESVGRQGGRPSEEARVLIQMIADALRDKSFGSIERRILRSFTRIERIDETKKTTLTSELITSIRSQIAQCTATQQLALFDALHILAPARPCEVIEVISDILSHPPEREQVDTILHTRTMDAWHILPEINWLMFRVGTHVNSVDGRRDVLAILGRVAKEEISLANGRSLPNDGRQAERILVRLLEGGDSVRTDFGEEALALVTAALRAQGTGAATLYPQAFIDAAASQIFAIHKHHTTSTTTAVTLHTYLITETSDFWQRRKRLLDVIRELLKADGASTSILLTLLVAESHATRDALIHASMDGTAAIRISVEKAEKESLRWIAEYLENHDLSTHNLRIASDIWSWLLDHEKDDELLALAKRCQEVLDADTNYRELHHLFTPDFADRGESEKLCEEKTKELVTQSCAELVKFVERVADYLDDPKLTDALPIGERLGDCAETTPAIREFVEHALRGDPNSPMFTFGKFVCRTWNIVIRAISPENTVPHLQQQLAFINTAAARTEFLQSVFSFAAYSVPTQAEIRMLLDRKSDFEEADQRLEFLKLTASVLLYLWDDVSPMVESLVDDFLDEEQEQAFRILLTEVTFVARVNSTEGKDYQLNQERVKWLLGHLLDIPDIDTISNDTAYRLRKILKWLGPMPATWLIEAIEIRLKKFGDDDRASSALPSRQRLSAFVKPCEADGATPEQVVLVTQLIKHLGDNSNTAYVLPQYLAEIDPHGVVVPKITAEAIGQATLEIQDLRKLGKLSGYYPQNSQAWRTIAIALLSKATGLLSEERNRVMSALFDPRPRVWSGAIGEVASVFYSRVEAARKCLDDENEPLLLPYWKNRLEREQELLDYEVERQREERGE